VRLGDVGRELTLLTVQHHNFSLPPSLSVCVQVLILLQQKHIYVSMSFFVLFFFFLLLFLVTRSPLYSITAAASSR
jgi:hypothetical protein